MTWFAINYYPLNVLPGLPHAELFWLSRSPPGLPGARSGPRLFQRRRCHLPAAVAPPPFRRCGRRWDGSAGASRCGRTAVLEIGHLLRVLTSSRKRRYCLRLGIFDQHVQDSQQCNSFKHELQSKKDMVFFPFCRFFYIYKVLVLSLSQTLNVFISILIISILDNVLVSVGEVLTTTLHCDLYFAPPHAYGFSLLWISEQRRT